MPSSLLLLPTPRKFNLYPGYYLLSDQRLILLSGTSLQPLRMAAGRLQRTLRERLSLHWEVTASQSTPASRISLTLTVTPGQEIRAQGYELLITPQGISVEASDEAGVYYGLCTLSQIVEQCGTELPCLHISDWPDFPVRGVMLDISRDKIPTLQTLLYLVDMLAGWKINQFQLYTEHAFAYYQHPEVWAEASPITGQEIMELDAYCRERFVELVPNQNSFGHMHRWLTHPRYAHLAEVSGRFDAPWGPAEGPFSLCPTDPGSLSLVSSLYDELLPHFSSRTLNVGCDETFDLGQGRSKDECARTGIGLVYLEYLLKIYRNLQTRNMTMQYWGDIILQHPELIANLPKDAIALNWGYEADHPFDLETARFQAAGIPFYVCPGTSSWCSIAGRSDNALANLLNAAENGLEHGAAGYLITDWGDHGHWQALPVSFLGFAAGAAYSWAVEANRALDIPQVLSRYAFRDPAGVMGCTAYKLGNAYKACGIEWANASVLFSILQRPLEQLRSKEKIHAIPFHIVLELINEADYSLSYSQMEASGDSLVQPELVLKEYDLTARLLRHACWRGILATESDSLASQNKLHRDLDQDMQAIIDDYRQVWLERNRPGGLFDSVARLEKTREDYQTSTYAAVSD